MKKETKCSILYTYVAIFFFVLHAFSYAKKEDIKDTWLAQELNEAIPLLEVMCLLMFDLYSCHPPSAARVHLQRTFTCMVTLSIILTLNCPFAGPRDGRGR